MSGISRQHDATPKLLNCGHCAYSDGGSLPNKHAMKQSPFIILTLTPVSLSIQASATSPPPSLCTLAKQCPETVSIHNFGFIARELVHPLRHNICAFLLGHHHIKTSPHCNIRQQLSCGTAGAPTQHVPVHTPEKSRDLSYSVNEFFLIYFIRTIFLLSFTQIYN